jgi:hypothetical protein
MSHTLMPLLGVAVAIRAAPPSASTVVAPIPEVPSTRHAVPTGSLVAALSDVAPSMPLLGVAVAIRAAPPSASTVVAPIPEVPSTRHAVPTGSLVAALSDVAPLMPLLGVAVAIRAAPPSASTVVAPIPEVPSTRHAVPTGSLVAALSDVAPSMPLLGVAVAIRTVPPVAASSAVPIPEVPSTRHAVPTGSLVAALSDVAPLMPLLGVAVAIRAAPPSASTVVAPIPEVPSTRHAVPTGSLVAALSDVAPSMPLLGVAVAIRTVPPVAASSAVPIPEVPSTRHAVPTGSLVAALSDVAPLMPLLGVAVAIRAAPPSASTVVVPILTVPSTRHAVPAGSLVAAVCKLSSRSSLLASVGQMVRHQSPSTAAFAAALPQVALFALREMAAVSHATGGRSPCIGFIADCDDDERDLRAGALETLIAAAAAASKDVPCLRLANEAAAQSQDVVVLRRDGSFVATESVAVPSSALQQLLDVTTDSLFVRLVVECNQTGATIPQDCAVGLSAMDLMAQVAQVSGVDVPTLRLVLQPHAAHLEDAVLVMTREGSLVRLSEAMPAIPASALKELLDVAQGCELEAPFTRLIVDCVRGPVDAIPRQLDREHFALARMTRAPRPTSGGDDSAVNRSGSFFLAGHSAFDDVIAVAAAAGADVPFLHLVLECGRSQCMSTVVSTSFTTPPTSGRAHVDERRAIDVLATVTRSASVPALTLLAEADALEGSLAGLRLMLAACARAAQPAPDYLHLSLLLSCGLALASPSSAVRMAAPTAAQPARSESTAAGRMSLQFVMECVPEGQADQFDGLHLLSIAMSRLQADASTKPSSTVTADEPEETLATSAATDVADVQNVEQEDAEGARASKALCEQAEEDARVHLTTDETASRSMLEAQFAREARAKLSRALLWQQTSEESKRHLLKLDENEAWYALRSRARQSLIVIRLGVQERTARQRVTHESFTGAKRLMDVLSDVDRIAVGYAERLCRLSAIEEAAQRFRLENLFARQMTWLEGCERNARSEALKRTLDRVAKAEQQGRRTIIVEAEFWWQRLQLEAVESDARDDLGALVVEVKARMALRACSLYSAYLYTQHLAVLQAAVLPALELTWRASIEAVWERTTANRLEVGLPQRLRGPFVETAEEQQQATRQKKDAAKVRRGGVVPASPRGGLPTRMTVAALQKEGLARKAEIAMLSAQCRPKPKEMAPLVRTQGAGRLRPVDRGAGSPALWARRSRLANTHGAGTPESRSNEVLEMMTAERVLALFEKADREFAASAPSPRSKSSLQ